MSSVEEQEGRATHTPEVNKEVIQLTTRKKERACRWNKRLQGRRQPDVTSQCSAQLTKSALCSALPSGPRLRREMLESWGQRAKAHPSARFSGVSWA